MPSTVIIADDHPVVVAGVETILKAHRYEVIARAHDTDTLFEALADHPCDVVVTDYSLPEGNQPDGLPMMRRIRAMRPDIGIVVLTMLSNPSLLRSLHRFAPFAGIQTHLYAFAGAGYSWRREQIDRFLSPLPASSRRWYEEPDRVGRIKLGAGSEIGLLALGGLQGTPEIGLQATRFFGRFQDSPSWPAFNPSGSRPKSDFALTGYLAFHLSFYFR